MTREISEEIRAQVERVQHAEAALRWADELYRESAELRVQTEKARLRALLQEASGKVERAGFVLPWLQSKEAVTV